MNTWSTAFGCTHPQPAAAPVQRPPGLALLLALVLTLFTLSTGPQAMASKHAVQPSPLFQHPTGVACDVHGTMYVVDWGSAYVYKLSPQGRLLARWGGRGSAPGQFQNPEGVAVDAQGNVYVADQGADITHPGGSQVTEFSLDGRVVERWGGPWDLLRFDHPHGVAVDRSGDLYIADWGKNRIVKIFHDGKRPTQWAQSGTGPGEFDHPQAITVDAADDVYVVDGGGSRIQKLSPEGAPLAQWRTGTRSEWSLTDYLPQTEIGELGYPEGIALDAAGNVYLTDWAYSWVRKFSPSGRLLAHWGTARTREGEPGGPSGMAVDGHGSIYVTEFWTGRIERLAPGKRRFTAWS